MKQFQVLSRPRLWAIATTRTSIVLFVPRVVGAEIVSASPTLTPSFSDWLSKIRIVPGCARSSSLPLTSWSTEANFGSLRTSMPVMPSCIEPVSETILAQPRPRWTANAISGTAFSATASTFL